MLKRMGEIVAGAVIVKQTDRSANNALHIDGLMAIAAYHSLKGGHRKKDFPRPTFFIEETEFQGKLLSHVSLRAGDTLSTSGISSKDGSVKSLFAEVVRDYAEDDDYEALKPMTSFVTNILNKNGGWTTWASTRPTGERGEIYQTLGLEAIFAYWIKVGDDDTLFQRAYELIEGSCNNHATHLLALSHAKTALHYAEGKIAVINNSDGKPSPTGILLQQGAQVVIFSDDGHIGLKINHHCPIEANNAQMKALVERAGEVWIERGNYLYFSASRRCASSSPSRVLVSDIINLFVRLFEEQDAT